MRRRKRDDPVVSTLGWGVDEAVSALKAASIFRGELMTCALCSAVERSAPDRNTQWRAIELDGRRFYVCTDHFPPDGASSHEFSCAYLRVLTALQQLQTDKGTPNGKA